MACSRVNFCGVGSGTCGGGTLRDGWHGHTSFLSSIASLPPFLYYATTPGHVRQPNTRIPADRFAREIERFWNVIPRARGG